MPIQDQRAGPDGSRDMPILIPTDQSSTTQQTDKTGVYPVQVRLLTRDGTILARLTTFLIRVPDTPLGDGRLRAALVLRLHSPLRVNRTGSPTIDRAGLREHDDDRRRIAIASGRPRHAGADSAVARCVADVEGGRRHRGS